MVTPVGIYKSSTHSTMSNTTEKVTLANLNLETEVSSASHTHESSGHKGKGSRYGSGLVWALVLFIFLVLVVFIVLVAWNPKWLHQKGRKGRDSKCDDSSDDRKSCDYSKAFLWAVVISIFLIIIFWILAGITAGFAKAGKRY